MKIKLTYSKRADPDFPCEVRATLPDGDIILRIGETWKAAKERAIDLHCTQPDLFTMACKV